MLILGLTGNIASGKSTVAGLFKELGAEIIDADDIARHVVDKGKPAWQQIVDHFGDRVLDQCGEIDRKELGNIVFKDSHGLKKLMEITHPEILKELNKRIEHFKSINIQCVVIEATLIDENGEIRKLIDKLIVVLTAQENQISRLQKRNNYTLEESMQRINTQTAIDTSSVTADYVIHNVSDIGSLDEQVKAIWNDVSKA